MKILFVTDLYPLKNEKIAKALYYFVLEWQKQGHKVEVIRCNFILNTKIRGRTIYKEDIYFENGIKIYNLNFHTPFLFDVYKKLPPDFTLNNYDVIISHMPSGALMANKLLEKNKIKYVCAVHCSDITVLTKNIYSIFFKQKLKQAYKNADLIAARSPVLKNKIESIIPDTKGKTFVAYSGVDDELADNVNEFNAKCLDFIYNKELSITAVASLIKRKRIDVIIKGLAELQNRNFFLRIIGDGEERKTLQRLVKYYKLEKNIKFMGNIKRSEVFNYLKKSSIFVLLSENETFGLSYLEAMAALNIVIASKNDGIDGILRDGENAFLIPSDPNELKECINNIMLLDKQQIEKLYLNIKKTVNEYRQSKAAYNYLEHIMNN